MNPFYKNLDIVLEGTQMSVRRMLGTSEVQLEHSKSGAITTHTLEALLTHYCRGTLLLPQRSRTPRRKATQADPSSICSAHLSPAARHESQRRMDYILTLKKEGSFEKPRPELEKDIETIRERRDEPVAPHASTVFRWRKQYLEQDEDIRALLCRFDRQGGKGLTRLHPDVEAIIDDKIETVFLARNACEAQKVHKAIALAVAQENAKRVASDQLSTPGLRTVQRRLSNHHAYEVAVARYGEREANRRYSLQHTARRVSRILEIVEIDHSPVDLMVVDQRGVVIGRPMATYVIDRRSRCVLGYHLSLAGHGTRAVFAALRHALLPKTYLRDRYRHLELEWPCFGWPETVLMDNGAEFHAQAVADALMNLSIGTEYAKPRTPNDKPHVERFLKTFNYSLIHRFPGSTAAKVAERHGLNPLDTACITLEKLDQIIHLWICKDYHQSPHKGLHRRSPMAVWLDGADEHLPQLKANSEEIDIEFAQFTSSALQHYGIDLNSYVYTSDRLLMLRRELATGARVDVKWPSGDVGHIFVWDPIKEEYFKVLNKDDRHAGLSLEQAKAVRKAKAEANPTSQLGIASGQALIHEMVDESMSAKALRDRKKGSRLDGQTSERYRNPPPKEHPKADSAEQHNEPLASPARDKPIDPPDIDVNWSQSKP